MGRGREKSVEELDCSESCYTATLVQTRRSGDFDGGCHWHRFHIYIVEGKINWMRKHGGNKKDGLKFEYLRRGHDTYASSGAI